MEIHQLEYLVALAEERSFTRAAERLSIAQPSLSQQIQKLEKEIGPSMLYAVACELAYLQSRVAELEREKADVN